MSEMSGSYEPDNGLADHQTGQLTAGSLIRQARESAGLHIAALAVALKVPVKKLEALEADRFDLLPDAVFVRALASSVCRNLKIDPAQVLSLLPQTNASRVAPAGPSINVPFRGAQERSGPSLWTQMSRPAVLAGLALLLAALVLIFLPVATRKGEQASVDPVTGVQGDSGSPAAGGEQIAFGPADGTIFTSTPTAANLTTGTAIVSANAAALPGAVASSPARSTSTIAFSASAPATPASAVPTTAATGAAGAPAAASSAPVIAGSDVVVFKATGESWIEVTDAKRVVVLRRLLLSGESVGVSGALPLSAVVGRADVTQVQVRGKPFDLAGVVRDNVARFEVR